MTDSIGKNIKALRLSRKMTLADVAEKTGVSRQTIQRYESGAITNIPSDRIEKLAHVFGVTPAALMGWSDTSTDQWQPTLTEKDQRDIAKEVENILDGLDNRTALSFDGEAIDDTTKELLKKSLENTLETARLVAKEKYTPNKYRK